MPAKALVALFLVATFTQQVSPARAADGWGYEQSLLDHPGIMYRLRCENCNTNGPHMWWVEFRNTWSTRVAFSFHLASAGLTNVQFSDRVTIDPGQTAQGWNAVYGQFLAPTVYTADLKSGPNAN